MEKLIKQITSTENLLWAWQKAKRAFSIGDIWFCDYKLIEFEANLYNEIDKIRTDILNGSYSLDKLQIVPFPKGHDIDKGPKTRQAFYISVRDQVTWLAVTNVIGKQIDEKMQPWSYGNRLYRPAWYEIRDDKKKELVIGNYRNSNGQIFRKWNQSWPLFRKHISATIEIMSNPNYKADGGDIDDETQKTIDDNESVELSQQVPFLLNHYFTHSKLDSIYWASLDFKKFYPKLKCAKIKESLILELKLTQHDQLMKKLIDSLFDFKIDYKDWSVEELNELDLIKDSIFEGLPTGLLVAGFLANIALLYLDKEISNELSGNRNIAHFRFVDDHVILATSFESLVDWVINYQAKIEYSETGIEIGHEKTEPKSLQDFLSNQKDELFYDLKKKAINACSLDPLYPSPLMTQTLAKVSGISKMKLNLLTNGELDQLISDLKHLLITDFPDQEVKKETRISFAATMLSKTVKYKEFDNNSLYVERKKLLEVKKLLSYNIEKEKDEEIRKSIDSFVKIANEIVHRDLFSVIEIKKYHKALKVYEKDPQFESTYKTIINSINLIEDNFKLIEYEQRKLNTQVYNLLLKAVKENHQKVRLWIRLMEFCFNQEIEKYLQIWELIGKLSDEEIMHKSSTSFMYYLFIAQIVKFTWTSIRELLLNKTTSEDKRKYTLFINNILSEDFISNLFEKETNSTKDFYNSIYIELRVVLGTIPYILDNKRPIYFDTFKILDWNNNYEVWFRSHSNNNINVWLYWILSNTHSFGEEKPLYFWNKMVRFTQIDVVDNYEMPILMSFPNFNLLEIIEKNNEGYIDKIPSLINNDGWLFEFTQTVNKEKFPNYFENLKNIHPKVFKNFTTNNSTYITLYEWVNNSMSSSIDINDIRLSEWTCLNLLNKIIEFILLERKEVTIFNLGEQDKEFIIHPANIYISKVDFDESPKEWHLFKSIFNKTNIGFRDIDEQIYDDRYMADKLLMASSWDNDLVLVNALGVLLAQLLCKSFHFPWVWNQCDRSLIWSSLLIKRLSNSPISSYSQLLIQSCLNARNKETMILSKNENFKSDNDFDPPVIYKLEHLQDNIKRVIEILEGNQISVERNMPRQLIPISLMHLSNKNNPFNI